MSRRNKPLEKKARAMERAIRKGRVPTEISLVHWLKDRGHAQTTGEAVKLIQAGKIKSESHVLNGTKLIKRRVFDEEAGEFTTKQVRVFSPTVSSSLRSTLRFVGG